MCRLKHRVCRHQDLHCHAWKGNFCALGSYESLRESFLWPSTQPEFFLHRPQGILNAPQHMLKMSISEPSQWILRPPPSSLWVYHGDPYHHEVSRNTLHILSLLFPVKSMGPYCHCLTYPSKDWLISPSHLRRNRTKPFLDAVNGKRSPVSLLGVWIGIGRSVNS